MNIVLTLLIIFSFLYSNDDKINIKTILSSQYFTNGSIYNYGNNNFSTLNNLSLNFSKVFKDVSFSSSFHFLFGRNISDSATFINPNINFENSRGFYNNNSRWYQSSDFKIRYKADDSILIYFGKNTTKWGHGYSSLFLSDNMPSYPQLGFSWDILKLLSFEYFYGSLSSQIKDTTKTNLYEGIGNRDVHYNRTIAAHKLTFNPFKYFELNLMELVIFGNRDIEYTYLMPFIPFWSTQAYNGDVDNIQICAEILLKKGVNNIYTSIFIDEWRPEWTFDKVNRNWFGYQIGFYSNNLLKKKDEFRVEYTWTDHRVYRHRFQINDSYSLGYTMGFWAGPHAEELYLKYEIPLRNFIIKSYVSSMKRGELTHQMLKNQYIETKDKAIYKRYNSIYESRNIFSIKVERYFYNNRYLIYLENELIKWKNPGFDPFKTDNRQKSINKTSINIGFTLMTDLKIN